MAATTAPATTTLGTPLADDAVRSINFFNGRLLTGGDLSREQAARRLADRRVAQAVGPGVAWGLEVSALAGGAANSVQVKAGLGVSASGLVLNLSGDTVLQLVPPPAQAQAALGDGGFSPCGGLPGATAVAADGLYLLTLAPLSLAEGWAPVLALDDVNRRCSTDAFVEAAQLRLLPITGMTLGGSDAASVARLRNQLAYAYFDAERTAASHGVPGSPPAAGATVTDGRTECDLPLAVVYLRLNAVVFIDNWAVRRRLAPRAASAAWFDWVGDAVTALGEAQMQQFQEHALATPALRGGAATAMLDWLPPAGFMPAGTPLAALKTFLGARAPQREMPLAAADAPAVLAPALRADAVKLATPAAGSGYRAWRIGGAAGPLLFARDRRSVLAAEQLWLDGTRAGLPGVADVQEAIDTLRAGTCLHLVLRPGMDLNTTIRNAGSKDLVVCFEPGRYDLKEPVQIAGRGQVVVHGAGALLVNGSGESVLSIFRCQSAEVRGLALEGARITGARSPAGVKFPGVLEVVQTPAVVIDGVSATCAGASASQVSALLVQFGSIDDAATPGTTASVTGCQLSVGERQTGLTCIGHVQTHLARNRVDAAGGKAAGQFGISVWAPGGALVRVADNVVRGMPFGIKARISQSRKALDGELASGRLVMQGNQVELAPTGVSGKAYGLSVTDAGSVLVGGNVVRAEPEAAQQAELRSLQMSGFFGAQVIVRDNLFDGTRLGIEFSPKGEPDYGAWIFQFNVALGLQPAVLDFPQALKIGVVDEHNEPDSGKKRIALPK